MGKLVLDDDGEQELGDMGRGSGVYDVRVLGGHKLYGVGVRGVLHGLN